MVRLSEGWWSRDTPSAIGELIPLTGSADVALRLDSPEYRSDLLCLSARWLLEWEILLTIHDAQSFDHFDHCSLKIHSVEVEEANAEINQLLALFNAKFDAELSHLLIIVFNGFESVKDLLWHFSLAEAQCSEILTIFGSYLVNLS